MNYKLVLKYVNLFLFIDLPVKQVITFELTLDTLAEYNSDLVIVLGDLNKKSKNWYITDKATTEGAKIEFVTSQFGFHQIINKPTHVLENYWSCIDLIFISQPNLVVDSDVHPSLHPNHYHQVVYAKCNWCKMNFNSFSPTNLNEKYGITDKGTLNLLGEQFMNLIGREHLVT